MLNTWLWIVSLAIFGFWVPASSPKAESASIAKVTLSVGDAKRVDELGRTQQLLMGSTLANGDRVITGKDAVLIIVFIDEGRVSLRADTELLIRQYQIDPSGVDNQINLELVHGAMRQISGKAARLQPERYRLNTPIAAIGVRGTDFLAKASSDTLETFIQEGKIVILPSGISGSCADTSSSQGCTPLASISAADASRYLRLLASGQMERRVITNDEMEQMFGINLKKIGVNSVVAQQSSTGTATTDVAKSASLVNEFSGSLTIRSEDQLVAVNSQATKYESSGSAAHPVSPIPPVAVVTPPKPDPSISPEPASPPVAEVIPVVPVIPSAPVVAVPAIELPKQLVWGRFNTAEKLPLQLPVAYETARQGRHVTVGELGQYALWRADPVGRLDASLHGQTQFTLAAGEAVFQTASQVSAAQIQNASLAVDFDRSRFDASLGLSHAKTGVVMLNVNGRINDEGVFIGSSTNQRLAGALSLDGKEAGFLFSRTHELGVFRGVTLWNAR